MRITLIALGCTLNCAVISLCIPGRVADSSWGPSSAHLSICVPALTGDTEWVPGSTSVSVYAGSIAVKLWASRSLDRSHAAWTLDMSKDEFQMASLWL